MTHFLVLAFALGVMSASAVGQRSTTRPASDDPREVLREFDKDYALIGQQNIFLKDRRRPAPATRPATRPIAVPEANFTLIGIVLEGDEIRAYVEDAAAGKMLRLSVGEAVGRGNIAEIEIDAVEFVMSGQHHWIELGQDFTGKQKIAPPAAVVTTPTTPATPSGTTPGEAGVSIEERMRRRAAAARGGSR